MDEELKKEYDIVIYGTGLIESMVAAAAARIGKSVLHLDCNQHYGSQWASFSLSALQDWQQWVSAKPADSLPNTDTIIEENGCQTYNFNHNSKVYTNVYSMWHVRERDEQADTSSNTDSNEMKDDSSAIENMDEDAKQTVDAQESSSSDSRVNQSRTLHTQENVLKNSRRYNIDLAPKVLYTRGPMVELLISSNVARYLEFKGVNTLLCWLSSRQSIAAVPFTRSQVFSSNSVSLLQKRLLMKFMQFAGSYKEHNDQWSDDKDAELREYLTKQRITGDLQEYIINGIALRGPDVTVQEGLESINLFLRCINRYGPSPMLSSLYGSGELPQAFCRLCAVFEGTYVLDRSLSTITVKDNTVMSVTTATGLTVNCKHLVMEATYAPQALCSQRHNTDGPSTLSRGIIISTCDLLQDFSPAPQKDEDDEPVTSSESSTTSDAPPKGGVALLKLTGEAGQLVTVIQLATDTGTTAPSTWLLHLTCESSKEERTAQDDLQPIIQRLLEHYKQHTQANEDELLIYSLYFNQQSMNCSSECSNLHLCRGPDGHLDYDEAVGEAKRIFSAMCPDEEFMPRAPDHEDIIFDGPTAEEKEGEEVLEEEHEGEGSSNNEIKEAK